MFTGMEEKAEGNSENTTSFKDTIQLENYQTPLRTYATYLDYRATKNSVTKLITTLTGSAFNTPAILNKIFGILSGNFDNDTAIINIISRLKVVELLDLQNIDLLCTANCNYQGINNFLERLYGNRINHELLNLILTYYTANIKRFATEELATVINALGSRFTSEHIKFSFQCREKSGYLLLIIISLIKADRDRNRAAFNTENFALLRKQLEYLEVISSAIFTLDTQQLQNGSFVILSQGIFEAICEAGFYAERVAKAIIYTHNKNFLLNDWRTLLAGNNGFEAMYIAEYYHFSNLLQITNSLDILIDNIPGIIFALRQFLNLASLTPNIFIQLHDTQSYDAESIAFYLMLAPLVNNDKTYTSKAFRNRATLSTITKEMIHKCNSETITEIIPKIEPQFIIPLIDMWIENSHNLIFLCDVILNNKDYIDNQQYELSWAIDPEDGLLKQGINENNPKEEWELDISKHDFLNLLQILIWAKIEAPEKESALIAWIFSDAEQKLKEDDIKAIKTRMSGNYNESKAEPDESKKISSYGIFKEQKNKLPPPLQDIVKGYIGIEHIGLVAFEEKEKKPDILLENTSFSHETSSTSDAVSTMVQRGTLVATPLPSSKPSLPPLLQEEAYAETNFSPINNALL